MINVSAQCLSTLQAVKNARVMRILVMTLGELLFTVVKLDLSRIDPYAEITSFVF